jgi:hypothetical protein
VMDNDGIVRTIQNMGISQLPYPMKKHIETFNHARYINDHENRAFCFFHGDVIDTGRWDLIVHLWYLKRLRTC